MPMAAALNYQKAGKIKHIGFYTHGPADNSNKFSYVNIHYHSFRSYHAEGTTDGLGGHGNMRAVQRAHELDMGVFNMTPMKILHSTI
jgi:predicted aldo/keto reductase-like oxidoreductase